MAATPLVPTVDPSQSPDRESDAAEIDLDELQDARHDPKVKTLLKDALAAGQRVTREGRNRWS